MWFTNNLSNSSILTVWFTKTPGNPSFLTVHVLVLALLQILIIPAFCPCGSQEKHFDCVNPRNSSILTVYVITKASILTVCFTSGPTTSSMVTVWFTKKHNKFLQFHKNPSNSSILTVRFTNNARNSSFLIGLQKFFVATHRHATPSSKTCLACGLVFWETRWDERFWKWQKLTTLNSEKLQEINVSDFNSVIISAKITGTNSLGN